jgi:hypothetical protein
MTSAVPLTSGRAWVLSAFPVSSATVRATRFGLCLDGVGDPQKHPATFARRHEFPALKRGLLRANGGIDIGGRGARDLADDGAVSRIFDPRYSDRPSSSTALPLISIIEPHRRVLATFFSVAVAIVSPEGRVSNAG